MTSSFSQPTLSRRVHIRIAIARVYAARTFSLDQPFLNNPIASVFAKATHVQLTGGGSSSTFNETSPISSMGTFNRSANTSMPLPVPAAHLSFIKNEVTLPDSSQRIAF